MIPRIDAELLLAGDSDVLAQVRDAARDVGFLTLHNTPIPTSDIAEVFEAYAAFFARPVAEKDAVNMARTQSNRGWGQVGPNKSIPTLTPITNRCLIAGLKWLDQICPPMRQTNGLMFKQISVL